MPVMRISEDTWKRLQTWAIPLEDSPDDALRRVLDAAEARRQGKAGGKTVPQPVPSQLATAPPQRRKRRGRVQKLAQDAYRGPILLALRELGGSGSMAEVLDRVLAPARWEEVSVPLYIEAMDPFKDSKQVDPYRFETFDEVMDAVKKTLDRYIGGFIEVRESFEDGRLYDIAPLPLLSAFSRGPLECGRDITQGGMEYTIHMPELLGLSHVVDSLKRIRKYGYVRSVIKEIR